MNLKEVESFLKLQPQLKSTYDEIALLSKKKPTDEINLFKLKFINNILSRANGLLGEEYKPFPGEFDLFDKDDIPNNGDVVLMLSHYLTSLEQVRCNNIEYDSMDSHSWYWVVDNKISDLRTDYPTIK